MTAMERLLYWILLVYTILQMSEAAPLTVYSVLSSPFLMEVKDDEFADNSTYRGYIIDLLDEVKKKANFEYRIEISPDGTFGRELTPGNWSGTINEVIQMRADFAAGPITITSKRAKSVDFSTPFLTTPFGIVLQKPENIEESVEHRLLRIWAPLKPSVWMLIFISFILTSSLLYVVSYFNPYEWRRMSHDGEATLRERESFTCMNCFWFAISALMWQGYIRAPRSIGGRIIVMFWWLFAIISISCYIANLSNLLKLESNTKSIEKIVAVKNFNDFVNSDIPYIITKGGAMEEFISKSEARIARQLRSKRYNTVNSIKEGLEKVNDEPTQALAFIGESMMIKYYLRSYSCKLYVVEDPSFYRQYALVLPKDSAIQRRLNTAISSLDEIGILNDIYERWFSSSCQGISFDLSRPELYEVPKFFVLDVCQFSGAILALAIGLVFGGLVTLIEFIIYKEQEKEKTKAKRRARLDVQQEPEAEGTSDSAIRLLSVNKSTTVV